MLPWIAEKGVTSLDLTPHLADTRNVLLMTEGGGILFNWRLPGIYEVHTNFLKAYRGRHAIRASLNAYRWMFTRTDCLTLQTKVPAHNKGAAWFCRMVGATQEFERKAMWSTEGGMVDMGYWELRYDDWVRKTPDLAASGHLFHVRLEEEFARFGKTELHHPEEECHDRHVGACVEMIYGGQVEKGLLLYNIWASFAGYGLIDRVTVDPLVLDIGDALLQVDVPRETFKALLVRGVN